MTTPPPFIEDGAELPLDRFTLIRRMLIAKRSHAEIAYAAGVTEARVARIAGVARPIKPARRNTRR